MAPAIKRNASFVLGLATALLLSGALSPLPAKSEGLNLGETQEKSLESFDKPNPHFALDCSECHAKRPVPGKDTADTVTFVNGEKGNVDLCSKCHDSMNNLHPVDVDPAKAVPPVSPPPVFPLETRGEGRRGGCACRFFRRQCRRCFLGRRLECWRSCLRRASLLSVALLAIPAHHGEL